MYLEESRSEVKLDCELIDHFSILAIHRYLVTKETETDIGIPNQKSFELHDGRVNASKLYSL